MTTRTALTRRTDPSLQDYQAGWMSDSAKPSEPSALRRKGKADRAMDLAIR